MYAQPVPLVFACTVWSLELTFGRHIYICIPLYRWCNCAYVTFDVCVLLLPRRCRPIYHVRSLSLCGRRETVCTDVHVDGELGAGVQRVLRGFPELPRSGKPKREGEKCRSCNSISYLRVTGVG